MSEGQNTSLENHLLSLKKFVLVHDLGVLYMYGWVLNVYGWGNLALWHKVMCYLPEIL